MRIERLTPMLVKLLTIMRDAIDKFNRNSIHPERDLHLSYSERANFQKLRYFGLIHHDPDNYGYWLLTLNGGKFVNRDENKRTAIHKEVTIQDNKIVAYSQQMVWFDGVDLTEKPFLLKQEDYREQKQPRLNFFVGSNRYRVGQ